MAVKNLTKVLTPNLEIQVGDKTYSVPPPSKDDGKLMIAINAVGAGAVTSVGDVCPTCGRTGEIEVDPDLKALVEANAGRDLGEITLGAAYQEMIDDGLDGVAIEKLELYGLYYWTLGETAADNILEMTDEARTPAPKDQKHSKSGRPTA